MDKEDILLYVFIIQKKLQMRHLSHAQELFLSVQVPKQSVYFIIKCAIPR